MKALALVTLVCLLVPTALSAATLLLPKEKSPDKGYTFLMIVPCYGTISGLVQLAVDTKDEAQAIANYVEGRSTAKSFVASMVSVDPVWQTEDLNAFTVDCGPTKATP